MTAKPRIGVIGTGYLGRLHARVLTEMPEVEVVGFVDPKVSEVPGLRRFNSIAALAAEVDCAVVATTTIAHFAVARELIEAGRDVLVEKPITASAEDARR